ncbi:GTPase [Photobacterium leiognathi subsp. mandapamensis]|nr:GTPase [Photobacterium leiognathi subsp. mandapamensis]
MNNIQNELYAMLESFNVNPSDEYKECIEKYLTADLSFTSELMEGLAKTIFRSKKMMAYYLLHNSIDEAKGAARLRLMANRYADEELKQKMLRHYNDEMNHSTMFASLIPLTGYEAEVDDTGVEGELTKILDFDDNIKTFIFRVHSIEVRSWRLLLLHLKIIEGSNEQYMKDMQPTIQNILEDEMRHVSYTAQYVSQWLHQDPYLSQSFINCITHTNRETWEDLSAMSNFMRDNVVQLMQEAEV